MNNNDTNHDPNNIVAGLLELAIDIHKEREATYGGKTSQNVFEDSATIANVIIRKNLNAMDIAVVMLAMKLARYGNILELIEKFKDPSNSFTLEKLRATIYDSALDGMNYLALTERERQKLDV